MTTSAPVDLYDNYQLHSLYLHAYLAAKGIVSAPSIAQAGFAIHSWQLEQFCDEWQIEEKERKELLDWFEKFHEEHLIKDLDNHIGWKGGSF